MKQSENKIEIRNGKPVVCYYYGGELTDVMTIYKVKDKPYIRRFGQIFYITDELLNDLRNIMKTV